MTSSTSSWALDQDLPCAPKFVLFRLCDSGGMARIIRIDFESFGDKCGLSASEAGEAIDELDERGMLRVLDRGATWVQLRLLYPEQDFERPTEKSAPKSDNRQGWLYILSTPHGVSKVGITTDLPSRIRALDTNAAVDLQLAWSHQTLMVLARALEKAILAHFDGVRFKGEWLRTDAAEVIKVAEAMIAGEKI